MWSSLRFACSRTRRLPPLYSSLYAFSFTFGARLRAWSAHFRILSFLRCTSAIYAVFNGIILICCMPLWTISYVSSMNAFQNSFDTLYSLFTVLVVFLIIIDTICIGIAYDIDDIFWSDFPSCPWLQDCDAVCAMYSQHVKSGSKWDVHIWALQLPDLLVLTVHLAYSAVAHTLKPSRRSAAIIF